MRSVDTARFAPVGRFVRQTVGLVRKEVMEVIRQPRLLLVMVIGPFLVLATFALGFDQQRTVLTTTFVGPTDSPYEASLDEFAGELDRYVDNAGYSSDLVAARQALADGDIDLIVIFPEDPAGSVLEGERAQISVLHDKIDPIQQTTVEVSTQVAVQELNATILETVVSEVQAELVPLDEGVAEASELIDEFDRARTEGDVERLTELSNALDRNADSIGAITDTTSEIVDDLGADPERRAELDDLLGSVETYRTSASELGDAIDEVSDDDIDRLREALAVIEERGQQAATLDPRVLVRPFVGETESFQRDDVSIESFFAPAAIALLLQHMVLTFAAMSLVSDRSLGLFELYRVGPIGPGRILLGKALAFGAIGVVSASALLLAVRFGLDVPFRGDLGWVVAAVVGLVLASIALGLLVSMVATSDTQAIQYALLTLLAGLFFSGFFLDLDAFRYPFKAVAWLMPVTYGVRLLRDVMLRGADPAWPDLLGLLALVVVYGGAAALLFVRRLRVR